MGDLAPLPGMIAAADMLIQLYLSCAALAGLGALHLILTRRDRWDPINRRFLFGLRVTMLLFAGRVLMTLTGVAAFRILVLLGASLIPLAVLLLTEGLLRRHAPGWVKGIIATGAIGFGISAFWYGAWPLRLSVLLVFQILGFVLAGWLILTRDRTALSLGENRMVVRLGLSLILFIPMALGDFLMLYLGLPIQFSALSVLILCWLAIGLGRAHMGHGSALFSFAVMIAGAVCAGALIGLSGGLGRNGMIMAIAAIMAAMFLVAIFNDARALRAEEQSLGLLRHMATAQTSDPLAFLRDLQSHPLVEGAVVLDADSLQDMDPTVLADIFAAAPVLRRASPPDLGVAARDHIDHLFERYAATHILLVAHDPRVLIALAMPSLSTSPNAELELQVVQRMAGLMAKEGMQ